MRVPVSLIVAAAAAFCPTFVAAQTAAPPATAAPEAPPAPAPPPDGTAAPAPAEAPPPASPMAPPLAAPPPAPVITVPQTTAAVEKAPATAPAKTWRDLVTIEGLIDAYYQYNFTGSERSTSPVGTIPVRSFDVNSNSFTVNYAKIGLGVTPEPVGFRLDLGYGATAVLINSNASAYMGAPAQLGTLALNPVLLQQAYATAAFGMLTVDFGKFVTTAGAEVIEANKNWNYSRSILFYYIPLVHTGLRASLKISNELTLQASLLNGWNDLGFEGDPNDAKTGGVSVNFTAPTGTNVVATGYFGKEPTTGNMRVLGDLVVAHTAGNLGLNLNFDYANEKGNPTYDKFVGVAAMGRYLLHEHFALAARGEFAQIGASGAKTKLYEGTLTGAVPMGGRLEVRLELRGDFADNANFDGGADKNQFTGTAAFLAWF